MFTSLGGANFWVTLCEHAQILLKKAAIYVNDMTFFLFLFFLHGSNVTSENTNLKISFILRDVCYSPSEIK